MIVSTQFKREHLWASCNPLVAFKSQEYLRHLPLLGDFVLALVRLWHQNDWKLWPRVAGSRWAKVRCIILFDLCSWSVFFISSFYESGYRDGYDHGRTHGLIEGRSFGREKGYEIWEELGFYEGFASTWKSFLVKHGTGDDEWDSHMILILHRQCWGCSQAFHQQRKSFTGADSTISKDQSVFDGCKLWGRYTSTPQSHPVTIQDLMFLAWCPADFEGYPLRSTDRKPGSTQWQEKRVNLASLISTGSFSNKPRSELLMM